MSRTILVSNRLPVTVRQGRFGAQELVVSSGGLVAGLNPLHEKRNGIWIGHAGEEPDSGSVAALAARGLVPVDVSESDYRDYYEGYGNSALWPLFHYLLETCEFDPGHFDAYRRVNEVFAERVAEHARPGDAVWIHDYQLMLLPHMVRERISDVRIGFFLHTPFPSSEVFRVLPQREDILRGLLGADLIGVHTYEYADHLRRSLRRMLGVESRGGSAWFHGREVRIETHPLGIDAKSLRDRAFSRTADRTLANHKNTFGERRVILNVERLDYTKGVPLKLEAFRTLLKNAPEWRKNVVYLQVAVPSREAIESYQELRAEVEQLVGEINGLYGGPAHIPIHYLYRSISQEELGALYRLADVAFVAPVRDGLNLVAKEYVACRDDGGGVLVLSEFAGALSEMGETLRVNPWDIEGTADTLKRALEMDFSECSERMMPMHRRVVSNGVHRWVDRFMASLLNPIHEAADSPPLLEPEVLANTMAHHFARADTALLMLDYDGSLREFTDHYEDAIPTEKILGLLQSLSSLPGVEVYMNSGREREVLDNWFGGVGVSLIAEHGSWIRQRDEPGWKRMGAPPIVAWKDEARTVLNEYVDRTPGACLEEKSSALVWHYREADEELASWQALELTTMLETRFANEPVQITTGACVIEIRPQGFDKGRAYAYVKEQRGPYNFTLVTGDDRTDEDVFERLDPGNYSVRVGAGGSAALTAVASPAAMRRLLRSLAEMRRTAYGIDAR